MVHTVIAEYKPTLRQALADDRILCLSRDWAGEPAIFVIVAGEDPERCTVIEVEGGVRTSIARGVDFVAHLRYLVYYRHG
jgi:hypothetical protein